MYPVIINNFGIKLREGGKYFNGFLTKIIIPRSWFSLCRFDICLQTMLWRKKHGLSGVGTYKRHFFTMTAAKK